MSVGTAVIGSLQFGYNTGVINAPQKVSYMSAKMLFKQYLFSFSPPKCYISGFAVYVFYHSHSRSFSLPT